MAPRRGGGGGGVSFDFGSPSSWRTEYVYIIADSLVLLFLVIGFFTFFRLGIRSAILWAMILFAIVVALSIPNTLCVQMDTFQCPETWPIQYAFSTLFHYLTMILILLSLFSTYRAHIKSKMTKLVTLGFLGVYTLISAICTLVYFVHWGLYTRGLSGGAYSWDTLNALNNAMRGLTITATSIHIPTLIWYSYLHKQAQPTMAPTERKNLAWAVLLPLFLVDILTVIVRAVADNVVYVNFAFYVAIYAVQSILWIVIICGFINAAKHWINVKRGVVQVGPAPFVGQTPGGKSELEATVTSQHPSVSAPPPPANNNYYAHNGQSYAPVPQELSAPYQRPPQELPSQTQYQQHGGYPSQQQQTAYIPPQQYTPPQQYNSPVNHTQ